MKETDISTLWFMLSFVSTGLLLIALAIPMLLRRVKPNQWYGFRTRKTLGDERIWYASNAYAGKRLLIFGIVHTTASLVLYFVPSMQTNFVAYISAVGVIFFIGLIVVIAQSLRYLRTL